ncbi:hypothetical protein PJI16_12200 [Nitrospira sp. MA-1]|nr:hypothetical protein [Nitrospira sp. MA-1]
MPTVNESLELNIVIDRLSENPGGLEWQFIVVSGCQQRAGQYGGDEAKGKRHNFLGPVFPSILSSLTKADSWQPIPEWAIRVWA